MQDRQHDPESQSSGWPVWREHVLIELRVQKKDIERLEQRFIDTCAELRQAMADHNVENINSVHQLEMAIQALQLAAENKGKAAGEEAGRKEGAMWGAIISATITAIAYGAVYIVQHLAS